VGAILAPLYPHSLALSPDGKMAAVWRSNPWPGVAHTARIVIVDLSRKKIVRTIDGALQEGALNRSRGIPMVFIWLR